MPIQFSQTAIIGLLLSIAWPVLADWYSIERTIMGTLTRVEVWHTKEQTARKCMDKVIQEMYRIDERMSTYKNDSDVSQINTIAAQQPVPISDELFQLIQRSLEISVLSDGAFDITYASVGHLYNFRDAVKPSDTTLQRLLPAVNYRHVQLDSDSRTIRFVHADTMIDLGGIAKGHAVDRGTVILTNCGIHHGLISAGGDTRLLGDRRGRPWFTGIRHPRNKTDTALMLPLSDVAISTSGDYERYFEDNGVRYHHIISPNTGRPSTGILSASVIGADATTTDALSTTVFLLRVEQGLRLIERLEGIEAVIIDANGKIHYSTGLAPAAAP